MPVLNLGYPAYAGIDLRPIALVATEEGLPRIRGDRPVRRDAGILHWVATPHTRGSTFAEKNIDHTECGYPAYAGIDPERNYPHLAHRRLPRIRGDRPKSLSCVLRQYWATPHTRGSTLLGKNLYTTLNGYPAYAGIDRSLWRRVIRHRWLPRIRGDRPVSIHAPERGATAAPQTRGIFFS